MQGIDYQWEADLADVQNLSEHNNDIKFLLVIVDVFSRFLWVRPLKDRKAKSVIDAFKDVLTGPRRPRTIRTDKGSEFYNRFLQQYLKDQEIIILCLERDESQLCREIHTDAEKTNLSIFHSSSKTQIY